MAKIMAALNKSSVGRSLLVTLCSLLLASMLPRLAAGAAQVEYGKLIGLIAIAASDILSGTVKLPPPVTGTVNAAALQVVLNQLEAAVTGASQANSDGDRDTELSQISKAIGAAEALVGMTSACGTCDELRTDLQQIIGLASFLKSNVLGVGSHGICQPNGILQSKEECDPLAEPTGCPTITTAILFCNDECQCQVAGP